MRVQVVQLEKGGFTAASSPGAVPLAAGGRGRTPGVSLALALALARGSCMTGGHTSGAGAGAGAGQLQVIEKSPPAGVAPFGHTTDLTTGQALALARGSCMTE